jgi:SAM-dependent methyltransferase
MRAGNPAPDYALGSTDAERERLIRQAARFGPFTERLFREAGIGPGQRVLDLSSGVGNVAMLAARLVGPSGEVVGIERDTSRRRLELPSSTLWETSAVLSGHTRWAQSQSNRKLPWSPGLCWRFVVHLGNAADRFAKER